MNVEPSSEQMLPEQVHGVVQELIDADYRKVGAEFFRVRVARLNVAGWVMGIVAFPQTVTHGRRGHPLLKPRNQWRNIAHFYNQQQMVKVWYWNNAAFSKADAVNQAERAPVPTGNYITFNKSVNNH